MSILVIAEHDNNEIKGATLNAVAAAQAIGSDVDILVAGANCSAAADAAAKIAGINKVLVADNAAYEFMLAENVAPLVAELAANYGHVLVAATTNGKNVIPRVGALLDVQPISDISAVISEDTFQRPFYAGNIVATVQSSDSIKVMTVRTTAFDPVAEEGGSATIEAVSAVHDAGVSEYKGEEVAKSDRPEVCRTARTLSYFTKWQTNLALRLALHAQQLMLALCPMKCRSVKRVKSSLLGSILP